MSGREVKEEKELWLFRLKNKLAHSTQPLPSGGWERLEKELRVSGVRKAMEIRRRWLAIAASVAVLAISGGAFYLMYSPAPVEMGTVSARLSSFSEKEDKLEDPIRLYEERKVPAEQRNVAVREHGIPKHKSVQGEIVALQDSLPETKKQDQIKPVLAESEGEHLNEEKKEVDVTPRKRTHTSHWYAEADIRPSKKKKDKWAIGVAVGSNGLGMSAHPGTGGSMVMPLSRADFSVANGILEIPDNQDVVFREDVPYLKRKDATSSIKHHQPVTVGISVRKGLPKRFSVETGLMYTLLSSDVELSGGEGEVDQKLHYIGLPLKANWSFLEQKRVSLYVSAGGMIEKCVYGKLGNREHLAKPWQFSISAGAGVQYNISNKLGLYAEPGIAYFFDNGSDIQTIRSDNPLNFNLQAGLRITY